MSKFKIGDRVRVKEVEVGSLVGDIRFISGMGDLCGKEGVVTEMWDSGRYEGLVRNIAFQRQDLNGFWIYADEWLEHVGEHDEVDKRDIDLRFVLSSYVGKRVWVESIGYVTLKDVALGKDYTYPIHCEYYDIEAERVISLFLTCMGSTGKFLPCVIWPSKDCRSWDGVGARVRVPAAHNYYYLNELFSVCCSCDTRDSASDARWLSGNYFRTKEAAEEGVACIRKLAIESFNAE